MKIKVTNLQNEEIEIDIINYDDIQIEDKNGFFKKLSHIFMTVNDVFKNGFLKKLIDSHKTLVDQDALLDFLAENYEPEELIYDCPVDACWKWKD